MLPRFPIRNKLAVALAVPLAGLVAVSALSVLDAERTGDRVQAESSLAAAAVGPGSLVSALQNERNFTSVDVIGMTGAVSLPISSIAEGRTVTDQALAALRVFAAERGAEAEAAFAPGIAAVETGLATVRTRVDEYTGPHSIDNFPMADEVFEDYAAMIGELLDGTAGIALAIEDAELRTGVELVDLTTRLYELRSATIRNSVSAVLSGNTTIAARLAIAGALAEIDAMERTILQRGAVAPYDVFTEDDLNDASVVRQESLMHGFADTGELDITALLGAVDSGEDHGVLLVRGASSAALLDEASAVLGDADDARRDAVAVGGALVIAALAMTLLVSRSITRPLASLTAQAEAMASERLPAAVQQVLETPLGEDVIIPELEPIAVKTRDEVRDVATALNVVQRSALHLAVEQAVLRRNIADSFVNLGRRNQNLLDRQLDFITDLERDEADPESLASLFRLDHLATRMRRNAESLLRLAGSEPQRRWSAPIELADVIRGALGEVEDYQRVQVRSLDSVAVPGGVGADLAHALAELLENALSFSPPGEAVEVRGRRTTEGYLLAVADNGLGMTPEELIVANRRLAGAESFTVAPSRYLGHYVAGHLASRLGIRIELQPGATGGLIAKLEIPEVLLVDVPEPVEPPPAAPAADPFESLDLAEPAAPVTPAAPFEPVETVETWSSRPAHAAPTEPWSAGDLWTTTEAAEVAEVPVFDSAPPADPTFDSVAPADPASASPFTATSPFTSPSALFETNGHAHEAPSRPAPDAGFGGLATTPGSDAPAEVGTTPSGLVRRVPGAQRPTTDIGAPATTPPPPAEEPTPEGVSSFLSDFSAGIARGIADAGHNPWEDDT